MRNAGVEKRVVDVLAIGAEDRAAAQDAPRDAEGGVCDRHRKNGKRHPERDCVRRPLAHDDRGDREQEAEEHRSGVAHEDARGMEVVPQEAEHRAQRHDENGRGHRVARKRRDGCDGPEGKHRDAGGQPVEPVDQVHGVHDAHDPGHRRGEGKGSEVHFSDAGADHGGDARSCSEHGDRDSDLPDELPARGEAAEIVRETEQRQRRGPADQCRDTDRVVDEGGSEPIAGESGDTESQEKCTDNGDSAQPRNLARV